MSEVTWVIYLLLGCLIVLFLVSAFLQAVRKIGKETTKKAKQPLYLRLQDILLNDTSRDALAFSTACVQHTVRLIYILLFICLYTSRVSQLQHYWNLNNNLTSLAYLAVLLFSLIIIGDFIPRIWAFYAPRRALNISQPVATFCLILFSPIWFILFKLMRASLPKKSPLPFSEPKLQSKERLLDIIKDLDEASLLNDHEKLLFQSLFNFRDRIVREVMVPRVDLFSIPETLSIRQAAHAMQKEGYSRVPVYKNTQDHIVGMLMYKDVLVKYMEYEDKKRENTFLDTSIENLIKPVLYTPETKKISQLLQEFRKKQMHLAVVVDEYGGTAGVVTIEDILEEIVGEIADEYDQAEVMVHPTSRGGWIVDARMNLLDLEEEIGIKIPQEGEYDTIAGYIFFRLGTIPKKGVILQLDEFELEILSSGDRFVEKVKITPLLKPS